MFSLQPGDELVFGTSSSTPGVDRIEDDLIVDHASMDSNLISFANTSNDMPQDRKTNSGLSRRRQTESRYECSTRKAMHRDTERKRRQEMSNLNYSLQSILPLQHNKGKNPVCNQIQEAVDYIKQMQQNMQELRIRRDNLKELSNSSRTNLETSNGSDDLPNCVTVNVVQDGLEILISSKSDIGLSRILAELAEIETDVVSCVSTRTTRGFLHKIQTKDMTILDVSMLQNRLTNAIK